MNFYFAFSIFYFTFLHIANAKTLLVEVNDKARAEVNDKAHSGLGEDYMRHYAGPSHTATQPPPQSGDPKIVSCTASMEQENYPCVDAFDGKIDEDKGWAMYQYQQKIGTVTGSFFLETPSTVNQLTIFTGWIDGNHNLKKFELRVQVGDKWLPISVNEVSSFGWRITEKDEIFLPTQTRELKIKFTPVDQVTGLQITVIDSWPSNNVLIKEIVVHTTGERYNDCWGYIRYRKGEKQCCIPDIETICHVIE